MILENTCNLCVIAVVSDGASCNRSFIKVHRSMRNIADVDVVYRTINLYHPSRYICFFADAPHLMKTTRDCMYHYGSGAGKTRLMWNDGREIVWNHLVRAVQGGGDKGLKLIIKLNAVHMRLNPYSKMDVRLATQVLSKSVGKHISIPTTDLNVMVQQIYA